MKAPLIAEQLGLKMRNRLIEKLRPALCRGEFTLASGKSDTYYLDVSKVTHCSDTLKLVCQLLSDRIDWQSIDAIGGPALGAAPVVTGLLALHAPPNIKSFLVRKEAKGYGRKDLFEGWINLNQRVVIVDDVTTTGGSLFRAAQLVETLGGAKVVQVLTVVDREDGAANLFAERGIPFQPILRFRDLF